MEQPFKPSDYAIGVDPGWVSLGASVVKKLDFPFRFSIEFTATFDPSLNNLPESNIGYVVSHLINAIPIEHRRYANVTMERYVSYGNIRSSHTEEILEVVGMLRMAFYNQHYINPVQMVRAIDWKTKLCQTLVKYTAFDNPSKKGTLDKEFSVAAAKHIVTNPNEIKNDHEADSILLAAFPHLMAQAHAARTSGRKSVGGEPA